MVIGKADCMTALVISTNGKVYLQSIAEPWLVEEVDTGPPEEEEPSFPPWAWWSRNSIIYVKGVA